MDEKFWIGLTVAIIIFFVVFLIMLGIYGTVTAPATVYCDSPGCNDRIVYSLPDGYDLNFKNPYNIIDTEDGIDVIFHFSKKD